MRRRIPVISDTHGLLRPAVADALAGCSLILHAGDVGTDDTLDALEAIAPTRAVRGNVDRAGRVSRLPATDRVEIAGRTLYLVHDRNDIDIEPHDEGVDVVISGHSHRPFQERRDGVLWINPGSVGRRRFSLPISMAWLSFPPPSMSAEARIEVEFVTFKP